MKIKLEPRNRTINAVQPKRVVLHWEKRSWGNREYFGTKVPVLIMKISKKKLFVLIINIWKNKVKLLI